jgi:hypothetical protein
MACPELLLLQDIGYGLAENLADLFLTMADNVDLFGRTRFVESLLDPADQRFAGRLVHDLGILGFHPLAFTRSQNDCTDL